MANEDIRAIAKQYNVKLWQIADELSITDSNFSKKLRKELAPDEKAKILQIIDNLANKRK